MRAYYKATFSDFVSAQPSEIIAGLHQAYASDGFASLYTKQTLSWVNCVGLLQSELRTLVNNRPIAAGWVLLLEYPLYRLRRRIDGVLLCDSVIVVLELKQNATDFTAADKRQVEEYALDLRDFHAGSDRVELIPMLWCTGIKHTPVIIGQREGVADVVLIGECDLATALLNISTDDSNRINADHWDNAPYRPVPSIVAAATAIFAGHEVRELKLKDAINLDDAVHRLIFLIQDARTHRKKLLCFLTGVPGSGKTLAGLQVVHDAVTTGADDEGDIVYLSGNTPLVVVIREAVARDEYRRQRENGFDTSLEGARRNARTRIQHINDFLREYFSAEKPEPPHEHVIVFDEAQRAWDEQQGKSKFDRNASEPELILDLMNRHEAWAVCVCLVGGGQEINSGEKGLRGWGEALNMLGDHAARWKVVAPPDAFAATAPGDFSTLGPIPPVINVESDDKLRLNVPVRQFRSPLLSEWVSAVLEGDHNAANDISGKLKYPIALTRELDEAKQWLRDRTKGWRRSGLLASSGARRLRAEGIGEFLTPADGMKIAHWYLNEYGDIRSSFALEVPANEFASQGLELDFSGLCWGGDLLWGRAHSGWIIRRLSGTRWQRVADGERRQFVLNRYRVLMTRAREGMVIWVPKGDVADVTRRPQELDDTAGFFVACGAKPINWF